MAQSKRKRLKPQEANATAPEGDKLRRMTFNYIKGNFFRVVHADGAWAGLTPTLDVHLILYCERPALPQRVVHEINEDGSLGAEVTSERQSREGVVREAEVGVVMNAARAKAVITLLQNLITKAEQIQREAEGELT